MSKVVCWLSNVLYVAKQLKHVCKRGYHAHRMVYVYVEVVTEYHRKV